MVSNIRLTYLLLAATVTTGVAASGIVASGGGHGWTNGATVTGPTDVDLTTDCDYFINDVVLGDTYELVEDYFGITETQFENWYIFLMLFLYNTNEQSAANLSLVPYTSSKPLKV